MSLYHKYRPVHLNAVVGNTVVTQAIDKSLKDNSLHHALLFSGDTGCGKTTFARIVALTLNCTSEDKPCLRCRNCMSIKDSSCPDYVEVNVANMRGIDDIRGLVKGMEFQNMFLPNKVYVFDECHQWTNEAQNCILKPLEEPPQGVYIILCTTEPSKLLKTVRSRCEHYELNPLGFEARKELTSRVLKGEGLSFDEDIVELFARNCSPNPRNLITELSKLLAQENPNTQEAVMGVLELETEADEASGIEFARALLKKNKTKLASLSKDLEKSSNVESIRRIVLAYMRKCLAGKTAVNVPALEVTQAFLKPLESGVELEDFIYRVYGVIYKAG